LIFFVLFEDVFFVNFVSSWPSWFQLSRQVEWCGWHRKSMAAVAN